MKQKTVVITCAPMLNEAQSDGLVHLFEDFEKAGCRVFYYGNPANSRFDGYTLKGPYYHRVLYKIPFYWVLQHIDREKWITRLRYHYPPEAKHPANYKLLRAIVRQAVQYFCTTKPDLFLCWNPHSPSFGPMADTARLMGINTGAIEWGLLPGTYIVDKNGTLATSQIFNNEIIYSKPEKYLITGERIFLKLSQKSISLYQQAMEPLPQALLDTNRSDTKILVIGIDMVDSGSLPDTHPDRLGLLPFHASCRTQALAIAALDPSFKVVLKPHPSHNHHPENGLISSNCWVINSNPDDLIKWADVVVCSGSKMEFSALLAGKPLVNVGAGVLYKKGCSYDVIRPEQLREQILRAKQKGITAGQIQAFKMFLGFLHDDYLYVYDYSHDNQTVVECVLQKKPLFKNK